VQDLAFEDFLPRQSKTLGLDKSSCGPHNLVERDWRRRCIRERQFPLVVGVISSELRDGLVELNISVEIEVPGVRLVMCSEFRGGYAPREV
jgi:hypothetical protein